MGKYFGTDGFRGEANKELTAAKAFKVGRYIGWYYGQQHEDKRARIIIGKDTRRIFQTQFLHAGICALGGHYFLRLGCLSASCDDNAFRILLLPDGRV